MGVRRFYPPQSGKLLHTISFRNYVATEVFQPSTPFKSRSRFSLLLQSCIVGLVNFIENFLPSQILLETSQRELGFLKKSTRVFLENLVSKKVVSSWEFGSNHEGTPRYYACQLILGPVFDGDGRQICAAGWLKGSGSSADPDLAVVIALAEAVERVALSRWNEGKIQTYSITDLKKCKKDHLARSYFANLSSEDEEKKIGWVSATEANSNKNVLLPADVVFMFYAQFHQDEISFAEPTSNGVGAHSTRDKAFFSAVTELVERDGFLMYWLNSFAPQKIDLKSLSINKQVSDIIENLEAQNFSLHFLDCKTEYNIPVLVLVTIDNETGSVVVNAAAGMDTDALVVKVLEDTLRWDPNYRPEAPSVELTEINGIHQRESLWYSGKMRKEIDFFLQGKANEYSNYKQQFPVLDSYVDHNQYIKNEFAKLNSKLYVYYYNDLLAKEAGLEVCRVVAPDLIPMFFVENKKHLNVARLYTFGKNMGLCDYEKAPDSLNTVPHPFI